MWKIRNMRINYKTMACFQASWRTRTTRLNNITETCGSVGSFGPLIKKDRVYVTHGVAGVMVTGWLFAWIPSVTGVCLCVKEREREWESLKMLGKPAQWQFFPGRECCHGDHCWSITAISLEGYKTVVNAHIILGGKCFQLFTALLVAQMWMWNPPLWGHRGVEHN